VLESFTSTPAFALKLEQEEATARRRTNYQDGELLFFILLCIISKHPVSKPIAKLTRIDRTEEVASCQKRKLRTAG
jgi:hypothetical protein